MLQFSACFHQRSCHPIDWLAAWIFSGQDPKALLWAKVNPTNPSHTSRCLHLSLKNLPLHLSLFQKAGKCRNGLESECGISFSLMSTFFVFYTHILTWNIIFKNQLTNGHGELCHSSTGIWLALPNSWCPWLLPNYNPQYTLQQWRNSPRSWKAPEG